LKTCARILLALIFLITSSILVTAATVTTTYIEEDCDAINATLWNYTNDFTAGNNVGGNPEVCRLGANPGYISLVNGKIYNTPIASIGSKNNSVILSYTVQMSDSANNAFLPSFSTCQDPLDTSEDCVYMLLQVGMGYLNNFSVKLPSNGTTPLTTQFAGSRWYNITQILYINGDYTIYINGSMMFNTSNLSFVSKYYNVLFRTGQVGWQTFYFDGLILKEQHVETNNTYACVFDETNNSLINYTTIYADVIIDNIANQNYTTTNGCFNINLTTGLNEIRYKPGNHTERSYYVTMNQTSNINLTLYSLLNTTGYYPVVVTVLDENSRPLEGATINYLRYFPNESAQYKHVGMKKTNTNGQAPIDLELYYPYYKFQVVYDDEIKLRDGPTQIYSLNWNYYISTKPLRFDSFNRINNIVYYFDFLNTTNQFRLEYLDTDGLVQEVCLNVWKFNNYTTEQVCYNCSNAVSAILYCDVADDNQSTYHAQFELKTNTLNSEYPSIADMYISFKRAAQIFGNDGMLYAGIMMLLGSLLGITMGTSGMLIMAFFFGMVMFGLTGIVQWTMLTIISVLVLVVVLITLFKVRR